jgi:Sec-independent protein secretion pathway component TatC
VPLYLLFEVGVLFAGLVERRSGARAHATGEPSYGINTSGE